MDPAAEQQHEQENGVCINDILTDDGLRAILRKIEDAHERNNFGLVCKRWLHIQSSERRRLCARAGPLMLQRLSRRFTRVHEIDFSQSASRSFFPGVSDNDLHTVASAFHSLRSLVLRDCKGVTDAGLIAIGIGLSKLRLLDVTQCKKITDKGIQAVAERCTGLVSLRFDGCKSVTDASLETLSKNCRKLEELCCQGCVSVTDSGLSHLAQGCRCIQHLDMIKCAKISDSGLSKILEVCTLLKVLKVTDCIKVGNKAFTSSASGFRNLEILMIGGCRHVTDFGIQTLVSVCGPALRNLQLEWCQQISDNAVGLVLTHCPQLENLNIACCDKITDTAFSCLRDGQYGSCLKYLKVSNCAGISVGGIALIAEFCHSLQFLDVRYSPQITEEDVNGAAINFRDNCKVVYHGTLSEQSL
eukprot:TRINITY_DN11609_c0_g1_i1.p1 TRINITY_DN11609_c0_g1~~TRINITY_DN11609_c0_g1_i1.p1  ORF type:complete len:415 (-),score=45.20 TRINITY_DN11609_c0_g1_i1:223-1467(-)